MASLTEAREAPERQLWDEINGVHAGMLSLEGTQTHFQPMAPNVDQKTGTIWFFTKADTDIVRAIGAGGRAHFCLTGKNHDYHAYLSGLIEVRLDPVKRDEYWSAVTSAWVGGRGAGGWGMGPLCHPGRGTAIEEVEASLRGERL